MPYLKNSLVNLTIILFSLFFLTHSSSNEGSFIFPKKKNITIKPVEKKQIKIEKKNKNSSNLPQKKPLEKERGSQKNLTLMVLIDH